MVGRDCIIKCHLYVTGSICRVHFLSRNIPTKTLAEWFEMHPPPPKIEILLSLSTGVVGTANIYCHLSFQVGIKLMQKFVVHNIVDLKQSCKDKVLS